MPERWPDVAGRFENGVHVLAVRVYYEDTDAGGVVYHANYLRYCERGRSDFLRLNGISQSALQDAGFVVRRMACEFLRPARLDDLIEVETRPAGGGGARLHLAQLVRRSADILFTADVTVALVDRQGRPRRIPPGLSALVKSCSESAS